MSMLRQVTGPLIDNHFNKILYCKIDAHWYHQYMHLMSTYPTCKKPEIHTFWLLSYTMNEHCIHATFVCPGSMQPRVKYVSATCCLHFSRNTKIYGEIHLFVIVEWDGLLYSIGPIHLLRCSWSDRKLSSGGACATGITSL